MSRFKYLQYFDNTVDRMDHRIYQSNKTLFNWWNIKL